MAEALSVPGFEHKQTQNGAVDIHYVVAGAGDPVVLLHGFPETWYGWRKLIPLLGHKHRIIAPDLRGLGESGGPETGYEKTKIATDIEAVVAEEQPEPLANILLEFFDHVASSASGNRR